MPTCCASCNMSGKRCTAQLPVAAQFQWVACVDSPGVNGTSVCVSVALPVALQWYSQLYSHLAVGSFLQYWWNSPNWIKGIVNTIFLISFFAHVLPYEMNSNPPLWNLPCQPIFGYQRCNIPCPWAHFQSQTSADTETCPPSGKPKLNRHLKED